MKPGRIPESVLKRSVLKTISYKDSSVISGAGVGHDAMVTDNGVVMSVETVTGFDEKRQRLAMIKAANNVAVSMAVPAYAGVALTLPKCFTEEELKKLMKNLSAAAESLKLHIGFGHTAGSDKVLEPVVSVTVSGIMNADEAKKFSYKKNVSEGMDIVMTKAIGLEGTGLMAYEDERLAERFPFEYVEKTKDFLLETSVLSEAAVAVKHGVAAMHDLSDGGIFGGLWEIGEAANTGLVVDLKAINVRQETIEFTNYIDENPYMMASAGSLLAVTGDGAGLVAALKEAGIDGYIIGKTTSDNGRIVINGDESRFLEPSRAKKNL